MRHFLIDLQAPGHALGWAVLRTAPGCLHGFYPTERDAVTAAIGAGADFEIVYGSFDEGSDVFVKRYSVPRAEREVAKVTDPA
jgi:hypothetical protein